jgi:AcrR family transcriptional regulator
VEAAILIMVSNGLGAATVRAVAKAMNSSPGHIHHHFSSADELRAEAFRTLWLRAAADFQKFLATLPPGERLVATMLGDDRAIDTDVKRLWTEALVASKQDDHVRNAVRFAVEGWIELLVAAVEAGIASGEFTARAPSIEVARGLAAFCLGLDTLEGLDLDAHSSDDIRARVEERINFELNSDLQRSSTLGARNQLFP